MSHWFFDYYPYMTFRPDEVDTYASNAAEVENEITYYDPVGSEASTCGLDVYRLRRADIKRLLRGEVMLIKTDDFHYLALLVSEEAGPHE